MSDDFWSIARLWNMRKVMSRFSETNEASRRFNDALAAEEQLASAVRNTLGYDGIRMRVRVPRIRAEDTTGGRGEIDMIVVNQHAVYVVEVKNWIGDVYEDGGNWIQCPPHPMDPRRTGNPRGYGDILGDLQQKARSLVRFMCNHHIVQQRGLHVPMGCVVPALVFTHAHAVLDADTQRRFPHAMTAAQFLELVGVKNACADWTFWAFPWAVPSNQLTYTQQLGVLEIIDDLPTWDTITLHNGTVRTGDVVRFVVPEASRRAQQMQRSNSGSSSSTSGGGAPAQAPHIRREIIQSAQLTWPGTSLLGLVWTVAVGNDRPGCVLTLKPGCGVAPEFQGANMILKGDAAAAASASTAGAVGSPMSRRRPQNQFRGGSKTVLLGANSARASNANVDEQEPLVLRLPVGSMAGEPSGSHRVAYIEFHPAGTEQGKNETIALHHIASIALSGMHHYADRSAGSAPAAGAAAAAAASQ